MVLPTLTADAPPLSRTLVSLLQIVFVLGGRSYDRDSTFCSLAALFACALPAAVLAQLTTASISGTLTDSTGATVPGAAISAVEMSTGAIARAHANSEGFYVLSGIVPGLYRLRVEKEGFQAYVREGVVVEVNRPVNLDVTLRVGATTQTLTVSAAPEQVNLRSQTISYEVTRQMNYL